MNVLNKVSIQCSLNKYLLSASSVSGNALNMKKIGQNSCPDEDQGQRTYIVSVCAVFFVYHQSEIERVNWEVRAKNTDDERGPSCPSGLSSEPFPDVTMPQNQQGSG